MPRLMPQSLASAFGVTPSSPQRAEYQQLGVWEPVRDESPSFRRPPSPRRHFRQPRNLLELLCGSRDENAFLKILVAVLAFIFVIRRVVPGIDNKLDGRVKWGQTSSAPHGGLFSPAQIACSPTTVPAGGIVKCNVTYGSDAMMWERLGPMAHFEKAHDHHNVYHASFKATSTGVTGLAVSKSKLMRKSIAKVTVTPGEPVPEKTALRCTPSRAIAGQIVRCSLQAIDGFGNSVSTLSGLDVSATAWMKDKVELHAIKVKEGFEIQTAAAGTVHVTMALRGHQLRVQGASAFDLPRVTASFEVVAGKAIANRTAITCEATRIVAGETTHCTLTYRDAHGNSVNEPPIDAHSGAKSFLTLGSASVEGGASAEGENHIRLHTTRAGKVAIRAVLGAGTYTADSHYIEVVPSEILPSSFGLKCHPDPARAGDTIRCDMSGKDKYGNCHGVGGIKLDEFALHIVQRLGNSSSGGDTRASTAIQIVGRRLERASALAAIERARARGGAKRPGGARREVFGGEDHARNEDKRAAMRAVQARAFHERVARLAANQKRQRGKGKDKEEGKEGKEERKERSDASPPPPLPPPPPPIARTLPLSGGGSMITTMCGAQAVLPPLSRTGRLHIRASFRGIELSQRLSIIEGNAVGKGISVSCTPEVVKVGGTVRCVLRASDSYGNSLSMNALSALGELHRMGEAGPLTRLQQKSSSGLAVEFVARAVGKAGVVLMLVNATEQRIAMVRVI